MNVEQLDGFFATLISGPETEAERVQPERLRSFMPKFCPPRLRALLGSDDLSQIVPK